MARKVDVPGTGQDLDLSGPVSAARSFGMLTVGVGALIAAGAVAQYLINRGSEAMPGDQTVELI